MNSSPDMRRWSAWCSQENTNAASTLRAVDLHRRRVGVLLDDREDVRQQAALELGEIGALDLRMARGADGVDRRPARARDPLPGRSPHAAFAVTSLRNLWPSS